MNPEFIVITNADGTTREMSFESFENIINARLRNVPQGEGSINAKVTSINPYLNEETGEETLIASYNIVAPDQVTLIEEAYLAGDYAEMLRINLTSNFRPNATFLPSQGEIVKVSLGYVANREGVQVLRVTGVSPLPKAVTKTLTFADLQARNSSRPNPEPATAIDATTIAAMSKEDLLALANANNVDITAHLTGTGSIRQKSIPDVVKMLTEELV